MRIFGKETGWRAGQKAQGLWEGRAQANVVGASINRYVSWRRMNELKTYKIQNQRTGRV